MFKVILLDASFFPSLGLETLKKSLKENNISCGILPLFVEERNARRRLQTEFKTSKDYAPFFLEEARKHLNKERQELETADYIGISFFADAANSQMKVGLAKLVREMFPNKTIIGGGPGVDSYAKKFMREATLDYALKGEAEKTLPQLIKLLDEKRFEEVRKIKGIVYRKNGRVNERKTNFLKKEEVEKLSLTSTRTYMNNNKDLMAIYTERGCPHACVFCSVPRKENWAQISESTIINGLLEIAKNKDIAKIGFENDLMFANKARAKRILQKIIELKLNKRFKFSGMATVDSFLREGNVDLEFIKLIKKANFTSVTMGTESLSDNTLREIKAGRYSSAQAIKVADALREIGISGRNFMLAGGPETSVKDFLESFYRSTKRNFEGKSSYEELSFFQVWGKNALLTKATREGLIYTPKGRQIKNPAKTRVTTKLFIMPKDPTLRNFFLQLTKENEEVVPKIYTPRVVNLAKSTLGITHPLTRKLMMLEAQMDAKQERTHAIQANIIGQMAEKKATKKYGEATKQTVKKVMLNKNAWKKQAEKAKDYTNAFVAAEKKFAQLRGIQRLRTLKKIRQKTGLSVFAPRYWTTKTRKLP